MIEPRRVTGELTVAASLCELLAQTTTVRVCNMSAAAVKIPAGKMLGDIVPIEDLHEDTPCGAALQKVDTNLSGETHLTSLPPIDKLASRLCIALCPSDGELVCKLLCTYQHVFSTKDLDEGYTGVVKHQIRLQEGAQPIKQCLDWCYKSMFESHRLFIFE